MRKPVGAHVMKSACLLIVAHTGMRLVAQELPNRCPVAIGKSYICHAAVLPLMLSRVISLQFGEPNAKAGTPRPSPLAAGSKSVFGSEGQGRHDLRRTA